MHDAATLLAVIDYTRARLLGTLDSIERVAGPDVARALAWRPGPGRAHVGWQAMHCAATHDKYLGRVLLGGAEADPDLVAHFGGGSTPSDDRVPTLPDVRATLGRTLAPLRDYVARATPDDLARAQVLPNGTSRTVAESLMLLAWHEAHHQGQIHLTWNLYKAAHGMTS